MLTEWEERQLVEIERGLIEDFSGAGRSWRGFARCFVAAWFWPTLALIGWATMALVLAVGWVVAVPFAVLGVCTVLCVRVGWLSRRVRRVVRPARSRWQ